MIKEYRKQRINDIKLDDDFFNRLLMQADNSARKRSHYNLHRELSESVQRLCVGLKKGTYIRPHYHPKSNKWELMTVLRGVICVLVFDQSGKVLERLQLNCGEALSAFELKPGTWHTLFPITDNAVMIEIKEGPYQPFDSADFAAWAPSEDDKSVTGFQQWLETAVEGDSYLV